MDVVTSSITIRPTPYLRHDEDDRGKAYRIGAVPAKADEIDLSVDELRQIARYAAECASRALPIFEREVPADSRPRDAIDSAFAFAAGGKRTNALRASAMAAYRAALETSSLPASDAAHAASHAAAAAFLHPLARAHQVKHVLGAAAHAARAAEIDAGDDRNAGAENIEWARQHAPAVVVAVLGRLPGAPAGGGRVGELMRVLDAALRQ
jgi:hypothetical protein